MDKEKKLAIKEAKRGMLKVFLFSILASSLVMVLGILVLLGNPIVVRLGFPTGPNLIGGILIIILGFLIAAAVWTRMMFWFSLLDLDKNK